MSETSHSTPLGPDEVVLESAGSRAGSFGCLLVFTLIWCGAIWVFWYFMFRGSGGPPAVFASLFLGVFGLVALALVVLTLYSFLKLFNKPTSVWLERPYLLPGESAAIRWHVGEAGRIRRLRVAVEGFEEATYQRGTNTSTDTHVFFRQMLADEARVPVAHEGRAEVSIPADALPTFVSSSNGVMWRVRVHGAIKYWPDVSRVFVLPVVHDPSALDVEEDK